MEQEPQIVHTPTSCNRILAGVQDTLYVLNGKWKLPIIVALTDGPRRFNELQRIITGITPKLLTKELRELEVNEFVARIVYPTSPVLIEYELTEYSGSLSTIIQAMSEWGLQHRTRMMAK